MFRTNLEVVHRDKKDWMLTAPLVWEGRWEYFIIRSKFATDFASIPLPVRWLFDNAGRNAKAGVLHDAAWRESRRPDPRVDPWHADGIFRRALRETGSTTLARSVMWLAVRAAAIAGGRIGRLGPGFGVKLLQLLAILVVAAVTVLPTTLVAIAGLLGYWLASWIVAVVWYLLFERRSSSDGPNWPWPFARKSELEPVENAPDRLIIIPKLGVGAGSPETPQPLAGGSIDATLEALLAGRDSITEDDVDALLDTARLQAGDTVDV